MCKYCNKAKGGMCIAHKAPPYKKSMNLTKGNIAKPHGPKEPVK